MEDPKALLMLASAVERVGVEKASRCKGWEIDFSRFDSLQRLKNLCATHEDLLANVGTLIALYSRLFPLSSEDRVEDSIDVLLEIRLLCRSLGLSVDVERELYKDIPAQTQAELEAKFEVAKAVRDSLSCREIDITISCVSRGQGSNSPAVQELRDIKRRTDPHFAFQGALVALSAEFHI